MKVYSNINWCDNCSFNSFVIVKSMEFYFIIVSKSNLFFGVCKNI